jgi:hypothetical protein
MKVKLVLHAALLLVSTGGMAATVQYDHPEVTIVAEDEPLDSVLTALGREMKLTVTTPVGINPVINCDIRNQPIKRAFKSLLGELSYSLVWAEDGERLTGLVILAGDGDANEVAVSQPQASGVSGDQVVSVSSAGGGRRSTGAPDYSGDNPQVAEHEALMEDERAEHEARMAEEREAREAEMMLKRQEHEVAHEARVKEERAHREAEMEAYIESQGLNLGQ